MSVPTTPSKKGEEINRIVWDLNSRWGLELPVRSAPQSPSKILNREGTGERIYRSVCFLFFRNNEGLQRALSQFEKHAWQHSTQWVYKPLAESDTLPSHATGSLSSNHTWLKRNEVDGTKTRALEETLLRFLTEAAEPLRNQRTSRPTATLGGGVYPEIINTTPMVDQPMPIPSTAKFSLAIPTSFEPSSSSTFDADSDTVDAMGDLLMANMHIPVRSDHESSMVSAEPGHTRSESLDDQDVFSTPPSTPQKAAHADTDSDGYGTQVNIDIDMLDCWYQKDDTIVLPTPTGATSRKRSAPDYPTLPNPRRTNFELRSRQLPRTYGVHHLEPSDMTRSFDSLLTTDSGTVSSTARTSTSTPLYIESATTSFGGQSTTDQASEQLLKELKGQKELDDQNREMLMERHLDSREDMMDVEAYDSEWMGDVCLEPTMGVFDSPSHANNAKVASNLKKLRVQDPFGPLNTQSWPSLPMRQLFEISRFALHYNVPISELPKSVNKTTGDYDHLWSALTSANKNGKVMPERSPTEAWVKAQDEPENVVFAGDLTFVNEPREPVFKLQLKPLKTDKSYRFARKFGGDRFFILGIPGLRHSDLPHHLRDNAISVRRAIVSWLLEDDHHVFGRTWRAFFVKPQPTTKVRKANPSTLNNIRYRIYLFAVDGHGFRRRTRQVDAISGNQSCHVAMTITELLEYLIPLDMNMEKSCLKLFARIALAVSSTGPTVNFNSSQIIRTSDAFAHSAAVRRLSTDRHSEKDKRNELGPLSAVMNDGCARISRAAAFTIATMLGLHGQMPSVYQGRIGGAKGIWMVDALDETLDEALDEKVKGSNRESWIEITDSQLKFNGHRTDNLDMDSVTFEVSASSKPLSSAALNYQLMPILIERGVPGKVFETFLDADLTAKVSDLETAMDSGLGLRKWNQENNSVAGERLQSASVEMVGGMPGSVAEKINFLVEHGFVPKSNALLRDLCFGAIKNYSERLETRMNIGLGQSTYAFMIADPLAVLEENEIHLGFSGAFRDESSGFNDTILNDMDVLVGRLPAHLPSDVQKVRAVFKSQLALYKDVIVFSSKGQCSLASKLSGGDYDGDQAWICWEPQLVEPFKNAKPHDAPSLAYYGITKDETKVSDIMQELDPVSALLRKGFDFNIQPTLLGQCTHYHEALCYSGKAISDPRSKDIASLLGLLVDSAKGGFKFTDQTWTDFKQRVNLPQSLTKPAYRDPSKCEPRSDSIIDSLVFKVAKNVTAKALAQFSERFKDATDWDDDLNCVWKSEDKQAQKDPALKAVLAKLGADLRSLNDFWVKNAHHKDPDEARPSYSSEASFKARVDQTRTRFLAIAPLEDAGCAMADRWAQDQGSTKGAWTRLKASALYKRFHNRRMFVWSVAGKELMELKVLARGKAPNVVEELWRFYKLDTRLMRRLEGREFGRVTDRVDAEAAEEEQQWGEGFGEYVLPEE